MSILVFQKPTQQLAKDLGVSDVAIGKFCKKHKIKKPERGYWTKIGALSSWATGGETFYLILAEYTLGFEKG